jgi:hypothetical protein
MVRPLDLPSAALHPADPGPPLPPLRSGWLALDAALGGGWPGGELSELCGHGRSTLAQAAVRVAQAAGQPVAWVDGPGTFCPATADVALDRLALVAPGTDGWPAAVVRAAARAQRRRPQRRTLLAADLLLRSRAFGLLVLDAPDERAPLSAWFRLARQARAAQTVLLLLGGQAPCAGSAAALTVRGTQRHVDSPAWALPPRPALEVSVLRRRGAAGGGVVVVEAATTGAVPR